MDLTQFLIKLDNKVDKLDTKFDKIDERVDNVDVTLAKQHIQLSEHIRRTEALEMRNEKFEQSVTRFNELHAQKTGMRTLIGWTAGGAALFLTVVGTVSTILQFVYAK